MKLNKLIYLILTAALFVTGCSGSFSKNGKFSTQTEQEPISKTQSTPAPADDSIADTEESADRGRGQAPKRAAQNQVSLEKADKSQSEPVKVTERKIIRNANLQLETSDPDAAKKKISEIAVSKNGLVFEATKSSSNNTARPRDMVSMTLRVPSDKFEEALEEIRKAVDRVVTESVKGRDVTEEFIDIEARLKTKKALEERFLEIMKQSKSVKDALNVQRELANVRTEIERIEGRKRFLENQSSFSTIKLNLRTPTAISGSSTGFFYELKEAIGDGFEAALTFILYLVRFVIAILPFLIIVVLPIFLILRYFWKKYLQKRRARKFVEEELNSEVAEE
ncbi:MAG: DUF4349 domain-containing protein [Pyrinomonadaceae bacterium]|nr:DUF4349 domain-containing protein [Pyrinomonadaceae bacterium]